MTSTAHSRHASARPRPRPSLLLGALALGLLALQPALAKQDDRQKPMVVEHADHLDGYNQPNSVSTFTGNVLTTQGTLKLTGDIVKIYTDADTQVSRVVALPAKGKLAHIEQIDDSGNLMTGDANELDYDNVNGIATLIGNAVVHQQCRGDAHGDKLVYNTQTAQITGESGGSSIVHMVFLPKNKAGEPPVQPGCPTPAAPPAPAKPAAKPAAAKPAAAKGATSPAKGG